MSARLLMGSLMAVAQLVYAGPADGPEAAPAQRFDLPAQGLDAALVAFGELTGYSVLVSSTLAAGRQSAAVHGQFAPREALQRLLAGTELDTRYAGAKAFTLAPAAPASAPAAAGQPRAGLGAYAAVLQTSITRALCRLQPEAFGRYRVAFQLWLDEAGLVRDARLLESSGVPQRDGALLQRMRALLMDAAPPPGLAQPLTILLTPRPDPGADCRPFLPATG
ncbi:TonB family protein [Janthinobacterium fluminis]|uniref:TonB family protein n=1 Tax=Janthinobacterium fluminis TaxID=2987524 RepID=A0ABT5JZ21_9BURK|nr:TonB family protein [Janthinobacterium fluminis]MDC8757968.1 TonB family protein [Janthinobacterium fluminis]